MVVMGPCSGRITGTLEREKAMHSQPDLGIYADDIVSLTEMMYGKLGSDKLSVSCVAVKRVGGPIS
jgi:hypothetical protein